MVLKEIWSSSYGFRDKGGQRTKGGPPWMHAVLPRAFPQMCCNSDCFHDMKFQNGPNQASQLFKFFLIYYFFIFEYRLDCRQTEWITSWPIQAHVGLWLNLKELEKLGRLVWSVLELHIMETVRVTTHLWERSRKDCMHSWWPPFGPLTSFQLTYTGSCGPLVKPVCHNQLIFWLTMNLDKHYIFYMFSSSRYWHGNEKLVDYDIQV
jgi:hypothetical protein